MIYIKLYCSKELDRKNVFNIICERDNTQNDKVKIHFSKKSKISNMVLIYIGKPLLKTYIYDEKYLKMKIKNVVCFLVFFVILFSYTLHIKSHKISHNNTYII